MIIYKFTSIVNESKKERKYNNLLKKLNVMNDDNKIDLNGMTNKINKFLNSDKNKEKFLKDYDNINQDIKFKKNKIKVKKLKYSQNEIFLDHVLTRMVTNDYEREQILEGVLSDDDILISSDNHIIDGHHRCTTAYVLNPNCKLECTKIDIPIKYALPIINAIIEASNKDKDKDKLIDYSLNIFITKKWSKKKLLDKMNYIITNVIQNGVNYKNKTNKILDNINISKHFYKNIKINLNLSKHPLKHIRKNIKKIKNPNDIFVGRNEMPQLDKKEAEEML